MHTAPALLGEAALLQDLDTPDAEQHHFRPCGLRCTPCDSEAERVMCSLLQARNLQTISGRERLVGKLLFHFV